MIKMIYISSTYLSLKICDIFGTVKKANAMNGLWNTSCIFFPILLNTWSDSVKLLPFIPKAQLAMMSDEYRNARSFAWKKIICYTFMKISLHSTHLKHRYHWNYCFSFNKCGLMSIKMNKYFRVFSQKWVKLPGYLLIRVVTIF